MIDKSIVLPEIRYKRIIQIGSLLSDVVARDVLLEMIDYGFHIGLKELHQLLYTTHGKKYGPVRITRALNQLNYFDLVDRTVVGKGVYRYKINQERLYFFNQFVQLFTTKIKFNDSTDRWG